MNLKKLLTTWWTFARGGALYVSFPIGLVSDALLIKLVFPESFFEIVTIGGAVVLTVMTITGWFHYNKAPYERDQIIGVEANPFTYKAQPGLGLDLQVPTQILVLKTMRRLADEKDLPYYDYLIRVWEDIGKGKDIREIHP